MSESVLLQETSFFNCTKDFSQDLIKGARIKLKEKSDVK